MPNQPEADLPTAAVLEPLTEDRARIQRIVARLDETEDLTQRADLAAELSRSASRYEDTVGFEEALTGAVVVSNLNVKLDHTLEDVANPQHPGADTVDGR